MPTLRDVKVGQSATVAKLTGTGAIKRRIMDTVSYTHLTLPTTRRV